MKFAWMKVGSLCLFFLVMGLSVQGQGTAAPGSTPATSAASAPAGPTLTADQVLAHYVDAIGGRAAWLKLHSRVSKGTIEIPAWNNLRGSVEIHEKAPDSLLAQIILGGATFEQGFDGNTAWSQDPRDGVRVLSGAELDDAKREADFYHPLDLKKIYAKMTVTGLEKVGDRDAYVVEATPASGNPDKLYFDAQNWLLVRSVNNRHTADGVAVFQAEVEDYRDVDGVKLPFTVRQTSAESSFTITFTEVRHNVELADSQFAKPAAEPPAK
jgi:zinc protease